MANQIVIDILADTRNLVSGVNKTNQQLGTLNGAVGKAQGVLAAFSKAFLVFQGAKVTYTWVKDLAQEQTDFAKLPKLFGDDAKKIQETIGGLAQKFRVDDGEIVASTVSLASQISDTYKGLSTDIIELALQASNVSGTPLDSLTQSWVKALNAGKKLSGTQIFKLLDLGAIIGEDPGNKIAKQIEGLGTINEQVAFLAKLQKANGQTISPIQQLNYDLSQLKDAVATPLLAALEKITPWLTKLRDVLVVKETGEFTTLGQILFDIGIAIGSIKVAAKLGLIEFAKWAGGITGFAAAWKIAKVAYDEAGVAIGEMVQDGTITKGKYLQLMFSQYLPDSIKVFFSKLGPLVKGGGITTVLFTLLDADERAVLASWADLGKRVILATIETAKNVAKGLGNWVLDLLSPGDAATVKRILTEWKDAGGEIGKALLQGLYDGLSSMSLRGIDTLFRNFFKNLYDGMFGWAKSFFKIASPSKVTYDLGRDIVQGLINGIMSFNIWNAVSVVFSNFKAALVGWFTSTSFYSYGRNIIEGLVAGMQSLATSPLSFIGTLAKNMKDRFKSLFNISSPSKVFAGYGKNIVQGLALGIGGNASLATGSLNRLSGAMDFRAPSFTGTGAGRQPVSITINAGLGTDPYELGRVVSSALKKYSGVSA